MKKGSSWNHEEVMDQLRLTFGGRVECRFCWVKVSIWNQFLIFTGT